MNTIPESHWLKDVAGHAGLDLALPPQPDAATLRQAWGLVVKACGTTEEEFTRRVARHFRIGVADVSQVSDHAIRLIPEAVARRHGVLAVSLTDRNLVVATADPSNRVAAVDIVEHSGRQPIYLMANPAAIDHALERAYAPREAPRNTLEALVADVAKTDFQVITSSGQGLFTSFELEDPAVVKLADLVLQQALHYRATEIHVEPGRELGRVRYRIDGVLQEVVGLPTIAQNRLVSRLKHLARELPGEARDGFTVRWEPDVECRAYLLATPTPDGEMVIIRFATPGAVPMLDELGFHGPEGDKIRRILERNEGLVLVTGPARSGTTSFVYACMNALSKQNVVSLEGHVEAVVPGVTQILYDASSGRSFAETLQQLLDRDPDVLHAGELRDLGTARIALRTAVTGRKVLATVHTAGAMAGIRRLLDLGIAAGRLAESLHAVVSLRLIRSLCSQCARPVESVDELPPRERKLAGMLGIVPPMTAVGCGACAGTGYIGQLPVAEVVIMTPSLRTALAENPGEEAFALLARQEGMRSFSEVALEHVAKGRTTVEEVERVLGVVPARDETARSAGPLLLVDDDPQDRLLIGSLLREAGFDVVEAEDGRAALELLKAGEQDFSLVLLDLLMPGMHGLEVLKRIRQSLETQFLPVVVLTSSPDPRDEIDLIEQGADDFMQKPVAEERLQARVRAVLRRSGVRIAGVVRQ